MVALKMLHLPASCIGSSTRRTVHALSKTISEEHVQGHTINLTSPCQHKTLCRQPYVYQQVTVADFQLVECVRIVSEHLRY